VFWGDLKDALTEKQLEPLPLLRDVSEHGERKVWKKLFASIVKKKKRRSQRAQFLKSRLTLIQDWNLPAVVIYTFLDTTGSQKKWLTIYIISSNYKFLEKKTLLKIFA